MERSTYEWVRQSRNVLLDFCADLKPGDLTQQQAGFGWSSVKNTLVHMAECYSAWLGSFVLDRTQNPFMPDEELEKIDLNEVRRKFEAVDDLVNDFLNEFGDRMTQSITRTIPWRESEVLTASPLQLFMHSITHEFHHKGQVVSMMRQMGYVPPDTDLLRTN